MADPIQDQLIKAGAGELAHFCTPKKWKRENVCDITFLDYRYNMRVDNQLVEVTLRYRLERCTEDYVLSDLVHSVTLFPGEEVFLSTRTRHSTARFTDDSSVSASQVSRSSDRLWMEAFKSSATNYSESQAAFSSASSHSEYSKVNAGGSAGVNFLFFSIGGGASVATGEFDSSSSEQFFSQVNQHLTSSVHQTNQVARDTMSVSLSQVNSHRVKTAEEKDELEVSTRRFKNDNHCHTVTHYFYQIAQRQRVKITLESRTTRPLNNFADTSFRVKPFVMSVAANAKLDFSADPAGGQEGPFVKATSIAGGAGAAARVATVDQMNLQRLSAVPFATFQEDEKSRVAAVAKIEAILAEQPVEYTYESVDLIPTEALYVESELGSCMVCEPELVAMHAYELERMRLENLKLQREIELLEKHKDYRCCDDDHDAG